MKQYYGDLADAFNSCLKEIDAAQMRPKRLRSILEFGRAFAKQMQEAKYVSEDTDILDSIIKHLGNMELQVDSKAIKNAFRQTSSMFNIVLNGKNTDEDRKSKKKRKRDGADAINEKQKKEEQEKQEEKEEAQGQLIKIGGLNIFSYFHEEDWR